MRAPLLGLPKSIYYCRFFRDRTCHKQPTKKCIEVGIEKGEISFQRYSSWSEWVKQIGLDIKRKIK